MHKYSIKIAIAFHIKNNLSFKQNGLAILFSYIRKLFFQPLLL